MLKFKFFIILLLFLFSLGSCIDNSNKKGKEGDFTFRKCTSCKILDD